MTIQTRVLSEFPAVSIKVFSSGARLDDTDIDELLALVQALPADGCVVLDLLALNADITPDIRQRLVDGLRGRPVAVAIVRRDLPEVDALIQQVALHRSRTVQGAAEAVDAIARPRGGGGGASRPADDGGMRGGIGPSGGAMGAGAPTRTPRIGSSDRPASRPEGVGAADDAPRSMPDFRRARGTTIGSAARGTTRGSAASADAVISAPVAQAAAAPAKSAKTMPASAATGMQQESKESKADVVETLRRMTTVRYFKRMNPLRSFPLRVRFSLSRHQQWEQSGVAQVSGKEAVAVRADNPVIDVRPHLPGCQVMPEQTTVDLRHEQIDTTFWITPLIATRVPDAHVELRYEGNVIQRIDTPCVVSTQFFARVSAVGAVCAPVLFNSLEAAKLDLKSQMEAGFPLVANLAAAVGGYPRLGYIACGALLIGAVLFWLWNRPRASSPLNVFYNGPDAVTGVPLPPGSTAVAAPTPAQSADPQVRAQLVTLEAEYRDALALMDAGRRPEALGMLGRVRDALQKLPAADRDHDLESRVMFQRGIILMDAGERDVEATDVLRAARDAAMNVPTDRRDWYTIGVISHRLGDLLMRQKRWPEALAEYDRALEMRLRVPADRIAWYGLSLTLYQRGLALESLERNAEAATAFAACVDAERQVPPAELSDADRLRTYTRLFGACISLARVNEVIARRPAALDQMRRVPSEAGEFQLCGVVLHQLGWAYAESGDWSNAVDHFRAAIEFKTQVPDDRREWNSLALSREYLANALRAQGHQDEADDMLQQSREDAARAV